MPGSVPRSHREAQCLLPTLPVAAGSSVQPWPAPGGPRSHLQGWGHGSCLLPVMVPELLLKLKSPGAGLWDSNPTLPLTGWVTLGKSLTLSEL